MDIVSYYSFQIITGTLTSLILTQVFKTVLNSIILGKLDFRTLKANGDFPSSHTATWIAFLTILWHSIISINYPFIEIKYVAFLLGLNTTMSTVTIICDAFGLRLTVQKIAETLKSLALLSKDVFNSVEDLITYKFSTENINSETLEKTFKEMLGPLKKKVGHLPHEVVGGFFKGLLIGLIFSYYNNSTLFITFTTLYALYIIATIAIFYREKIKKMKKLKAIDEEIEQLLEANNLATPEEIEENNRKIIELQKEKEKLLKNK